MAELKRSPLQAESERQVPIIYKGTRLVTELRLDILVDAKVIVEVKAVDALHPVHVAQVITYLKLTGCPAGLLLNFNTVLLKHGLRRVDHPDRYLKQPERTGAPASSPELPPSTS